MAAMYREKSSPGQPIELAPFISTDGSRLAKLFDSFCEFDRAQAGFFATCEQYATGSSAGAADLYQSGMELSDRFADYAKLSFQSADSPNQQVEAVRSFMMYEDRTRIAVFNDLTKSFTFEPWNDNKVQCCLRDKLEEYFDYSLSNEEFLGAVVDYFAEHFQAELAQFAGYFPAC